MPSNRDILEAQRFNRRRLVTAFTSGTPGGRELEPRSPLQPLMVGGVLMLVMALVALAAGRLGGSLPDHWQDNWVLFEKGTGDRFYTSHGVLHPLRNLTTAKLLATDGHLKSQSVPSRQLRNQPRGGEVGIEGAPEDVPQRSDLHSDQWTSCLVPTASATAAAGQTVAHTQTWVAQQAPGMQLADSAGVFVQVLTRGVASQYFVQGGQSFPVSARAANTLGLNAPVTVGATWLDLFAKGDPLVADYLLQNGQHVDGFPANLGTIGTVLKVTDGASTDWFVVIGNHQMARLETPVERRIAAMSGSLDRAPSLDASKLTGVTRSALQKDWPADTTVLAQGQAACATLVQDSQQRAATQLAWIPTPEPGQAPTTDVVSVGGGSGALVSAADISGAGGSVSAGAGTQLISDNGRAYAVASPGQRTTTSEILRRLGYQDADVKPIPAGWLRLVTSGGVELSPETASASLTP